MKRLLNTEIQLPKVIEIWLTMLVTLESLFLALSAERLVDYYPQWSLPLILISLALYGLIDFVNSCSVNRKKRHINIRWIFDGVSETSNLIENLVISRLKNEVREIIGNGASLRSIYADLDRIRFIASTKSMRLVEEYCEAALLATSVAIFNK